jgi:hypothetical protein
MNSPPVKSGYSAQVRLNLIVGGDSLELAAIGPGGIRLRECATRPPCDAKVVMHVDDFERRWAVYLPDGISANSREVRTVPVETAAKPG